MQYQRQTDFTQGTVIVSEEVDAELNAIQAVVNGNIDTDNIKNNAVTSDKLTTALIDSMFKPGMIMPYGGSTAPGGWLLCDGSSVLRSDYLNLFGIIGTTYGSADSTHFNLPDLRGRVAVGKSTDTEFDTLGETGGAKTHTLSVNEMPSHRHQQSTIYYYANDPNTPARGSGTNTDGNWGSYTSYVGGGVAHNNIQPYLTINYIIKT